MLLLQDDIFSQVHRVVTQDTEAFARRAAMKLLLSWHQRDLLPARSQDIMKVMRDAIHDLDWEVKLIVLDYWEIIVTETLNSGLEKDRDVPSYAASVVVHQPTSDSGPSLTDNLTTLCQCGCADLLLAATEDCDRVVQLKALEILKHIHTVTSKHNFDDLKMDRSSDSQNTKQNGQQCSEDATSLTTKDFLSRLSSLDFRTLLAEAEKSTDPYACNPETLLDDIIASMVRSHDEGSNDDDDAFAIDCY